MKKVKKESNSEALELKNQLARSLADYDNLRKRTEEEKKMWITFASQRIVERFLPVLDTLESALAHTKDQGLAIAISQLKDILKDEGLEEINPKTMDIFDHDFMEAIDTIETENKDNENKVESTAVLGWKFKNGPVIRHAKVKVFKLK